MKINRQKTKSLLLAAAMALGVSAAVTRPAAALERDVEEQLRLYDLPRPVRETIEAERGRRPVKQIDFVRRNGHEFYRVAIDEHGNVDTVLYVSERGRVLDEQQVLDLGEEFRIPFSRAPRAVREVVEAERGPNDLKLLTLVRRDGRVFYRAIIDTRRGDRMLRIGEGGKILEDSGIPNVQTARPAVRRGVDDDGVRVPYEVLPRAVRITIAREAGDDRVRDVYRYEHHWGATYEVDLVDLRHSRVLRVDDDGRVIADTDDRLRGEQIRVIRWDDLPRGVRDGFGEHLRATEVVKVVEVNYDHHRYYRAWSEPRGREGFWVTIDEGGHHVRDWSHR
jgi:hypothetical protein